MDNLPVEMPTSMPTVLTEMDSIEREMGTKAYWSNPQKQARYRQLIERKQSLLNEDSEPSPGGVPVEIYSKAQYAAANGTTEGYDLYVKASMAAADVIMNLSASEMAAFTASFERLPEGAVAAAVQELVAPKPSVPWSSENAVHELQKMPEGAILAREWGQDTRRNLAVVRARLFRAIDNMETERDVEGFLQWLEGLSTAGAVAVYRKLAA